MRYLVNKYKFLEVQTINSKTFTGRRHTSTQQLFITGPIRSNKSDWSTFKETKASSNHLPTFFFLVGLRFLGFFGALSQVDMWNKSIGFRAHSIRRAQSFPVYLRQIEKWTMAWKKYHHMPYRAWPHACSSSPAAALAGFSLSLNMSFSTSSIRKRALTNSWPLARERSYPPAQVGKNSRGSKSTHIRPGGPTREPYRTLRALHLAVATHMWEASPERGIGGAETFLRQAAAEVMISSALKRRARPTRYGPSVISKSALAQSNQPFLNIKRRINICANTLFFFFPRLLWE